MRLLTLGRLAVEDNSLSRPKLLLMLAYLTVEGAKDRSHLHELFWPAAVDPASSLRVALALLRRSGGALVRSDGPRIVSVVSSDITDLVSALERQDGAGVLAAYQGAFLDGFTLPGWGPELEEWVWSTREFFAGQVRRALTQQAESLAASGDLRGATSLAERAYRTPGSLPEPEALEPLYLLLAAGHSPLAAQARALGREYGLTLNRTPEEIGRYVAARAQPGSAMLSAARTSFVGRDVELLELHRSLDSRSRLITLLGPGGIGKSRLALQFAQLQQTEPDRFPGGVAVVPLESRTRPGDVADAVADTLGLPVQGDPMGAVIARVSDQLWLLVLDNFEQVVDDVPVVARLLDACPNVHVLVTSRERLNLPEELAITVGGMHIPDTGPLTPGAAQRHDAVQLFVQRATHARLEFVLTEQNLRAVLRICELLGGSPLGLELAAVWVRTMEPDEIATQLGAHLWDLVSPDRLIAPRHQSLRSVIEQSWQRLSARERAALVNLAVFSGGFSREGAAAVAGATIPLLTALVDKSMLRVTAGRFDFHPALAQFALEHVTDPVSARAAHAQYILTLVSSMMPDLHGSGKAAVLTRLAAEHSNVETALDWALTHGEGTLALHLAGFLSRYWLIRGHARSGRRWLNAALQADAAASPQAPPTVRAAALNGAAWLAHAEDDFADAERLFEAAAQCGGSPDTSSLINAAMMARSRGDYVAATTLLEQALARHRAEGNMQSVSQDGIGLSLSRLALTLGQLGRYAEARTLLTECYTLHQRLGDQGGMATAMIGLSDLARDQADASTLRDQASHALLLFRAVGERWGEGFALNNLALAAVLAGELEDAARLANESVRCLQEVWGGAPVAEALLTVARVALLQGRLPAARSALHSSVGKALTYGPHWLVAMGLDLGAELAVFEQHYARAARFVGAADALRKRMGVPITPLQQRSRAAVVQVAKDHLAASSWGDEYARGQASSSEQAALGVLVDEVVAVPPGVETGPSTAL